MTRYFFDLDLSGERTGDEVGTDCENDEAARDEATAFIAEFARDFLPRNGDRASICVDVRTSERPLLQVRLEFAIASTSK